MTQTSGRFFDGIAQLMTDAAGAASGMRREAETFMRHQAERIIAELDLVRRDEYEAMRELAVRAREETERLNSRVTVLEARLGITSSPQPYVTPTSEVEAFPDADKSSSTGESPLN